MCSSKIKDLIIFDQIFFAWTLATSATSRGRNFNLSNLNKVSNFSWICQLSYEILLSGMKMGRGLDYGSQNGWIPPPPCVFNWPKSPHRLGLTLAFTHLSIIFGVVGIVYSSLGKQKRQYLQCIIYELYRPWLDTVQDFLIVLDMKPCTHLVEISIFSLTKIGYIFRK